MKPGHWGVLGACAFILAGSADAALVPRLGGQAVYDTDLDVTWIADANLAAGNAFGTPGIGADGRMNWATAKAWIGNLNAAHYLGFDDWRLPITPQPDPSCSDQTGDVPPQGFGLGCTGSELGHLFYAEFGATENTSVLATGDPAVLARFENLQADVYWSGTPYAPTPSFVWNFFFSNGFQGAFSQDLGNYFVWAVRDGDAVVPVPAAVWLFGSGLIGLLGVAGRRR